MVMVNSTHIRQYAEQFNSNIWQVPSVVDTDTFSYIPPVDDPVRPCIGWSGSPTTLTNIKMIEGPLQQISQADICDIRFIGGTDFGLSGVKYTAQKWNQETEVADLRQMQIGLVPLPDNPWDPHVYYENRPVYTGIVPIGTPMASNLEVIRHGENGFLAESHDEWVDCISTLVSDANLRNRMSVVAAKDAEAKYSLRANTERSFPRSDRQSNEV
ncbi:MAG: hypothetical protein IPN51_00045 [Chloracidobacterium sp.]|nr:hypothetical protein [Chloracidobacterium sp.]